MITEIEAYFAKGCGRCERFDTPNCSVQQWQAGLAALRRICRSVGLEETVRWGHPCYRHADRNIAVLGAVRGDVRLSFFNAALMTDPDGVLETQGPNTRHKDMLRFTDVTRILELEPVIRAYLEEAKSYAADGIKPAPDRDVGELPTELVEALEADPEMADAFQALTPGRQRSYVIHLGSAKTRGTRLSRIANCRPKILAGKGALER